MKNLTGKLEDFIDQSSGVPIIHNQKFREQGIPITIDEGLRLAGLCYTGLRGYVLMEVNGQLTSVAVHPVIDALCEAYCGVRYFDPRSASRFALEVLVKKFDINPESFRRDDGSKF